MHHVVQSHECIVRSHDCDYLLQSLSKKTVSSSLTDDQISPLYYYNADEESCMACVLQNFTLLIGLRKIK